MEQEPKPLEELSLPALLRWARAVYGSAIRSALEAAGCDDVPRNGIYVISAIAQSRAPLAEVIRQLAVSKQAAGQLVDSLVVRGYLDRSVDPDDRRRLIVTLTARGEEVAALIRATVDALDLALLQRVGDEYIAHTRATLAAIITGEGE